MNVEERKDLAKRLANVSDVLDFDAALKIARFDPRKAEELIDNWEKSKERQEEFDRISARRKLALREEFG
jgi:hypothetical protein